MPLLDVQKGKGVYVIEVSRVVGYQFLRLDFGIGVIGDAIVVVVVRTGSRALPVDLAVDGGRRQVGPVRGRVLRGVVVGVMSAVFPTR